MPEYTGTYCQKEVNPEGDSIWINFAILVIAILALSCIAACVFFYINIKKLPRPMYLFVKRYAGWSIRNSDVDYDIRDLQFAKPPNQESND